MMRKYEPIWTALKQKKIIKIKCKAAEKARIKKAVTKEKNIDLKFKEETKHSYLLETDVVSEGLIFRLVRTRQSVNPEDL